MRALPLVALSVWTLASALMNASGLATAAEPVPPAGPLAGGRAAAADSAVAAEPRRLFRVRQSGKWGFIDKSGAVVLAPRFDRADDFAEGLASVQLGGRFFYVDEAGRTMLEPPAPAGGGLHRKFSAGRAALRSGGAFGYIDRSGQMVIPARFASADDFSEGRALACVESGCGYLDVDGRWVIAPTFMGGGTPFRNGHAAAYLFNMMGRKRVAYHRRDGTRVPGEYDGDGWFGDGLLPVRHGGAWGFIDEKGRPAIPLRFEEAWGFSEGLAAVKTDSGRCGYIDRGGAFAIAPRFLTCGPFTGGRALVDAARDANDAARPAFIDRGGAVVFSGATADPPFGFALDFADGLAAVGAGAAPGAEGPGAKLGYVDREGRYVWPLTE
jgi:WG repeat protein